MLLLLGHRSLIKKYKKQTAAIKNIELKYIFDCDLTLSFVCYSTYIFKSYRGNFK